MPYTFTITLTDETAVEVAGALTFASGLDSDKARAKRVSGVVSDIIISAAIAKVASEAPVPGTQEANQTQRQPCRPGCAVNHSGYKADVA